MELAPGIHRIETPFGPRINAVHLLTGSRRSLLIDTGTADTAERVLAACADLGAPQPDWVLTTHADWDHSAGNGVFRRLSPNSRLLCHESDRALIEDVELMISARYGQFAQAHGSDETDESKDAIRAGTAPADMDLSVSGGEVIDLGDGWRVRIMHTPGHSDGSVSVHDPRSKALIIGDAVLGAAVPLADGRPAFPPTYRCVDDYLATIAAVDAMGIDLLLTAHYPVLSGRDVGEFLTESVDFTDQLELALTGALRGADQPISMLAVVDAIAPGLGGWPTEANAALLFPLIGHLERLVAADRVVAVRETADVVTRYRWAG